MYTHHREYLTIAALREVFMFKNYLKVALRNITRNKGYSFINLLGLTVGITCCLLIFLWVRDEVSYDTHHEDAERIFRVILDYKVENTNKVYAMTPGPLAVALKQDLPQVEEAVRLLAQTNRLVKYGELKAFYETHFYFVDPEFFDVFTIPLVKGNSSTALNRPYTVVISEKIAQKYFGQEDPIEKTLNINGRNYKVTGVAGNMSHPTHFKFNFLTSFKRIEKDDDILRWDILGGIYTYIKVKPNIDLRKFESQVLYIADKHLTEEIKSTGEKYHFLLQPIRDIHLHSNLGGEMEPAASVIYVYIFSLVAISILFIACLNFINLSTALSGTRAKEIGVRKVVGANKSQLINQFLFETVLLTVISLVIAMVIIDIILPCYNTFVGKELRGFTLLDIPFFLILLGIATIIGIAAGSYPAFFLSSFPPVKVLKGLLKMGTKDSTTRGIFVISQFSISIMLILGTLIVYQQLNFMRNQKLGFDKEHMLVLPVRRSSSPAGNYETIKSEFAKHSSVLSTAITRGVPGRADHFLDYTVSRLADSNKRAQSMNFFVVDADFLKTYNIELAAGRWFKKELTTDARSGFIINETAVKALGWPSNAKAVGQRIRASFGSNEVGEVIGVVKDFHFKSLQNIVEPMVMIIRPERFNMISLKLRSENLSGAMAFCRGKWEELFPGIPFRYFFIDEDFDRLYRSEEKLGNIFFVFTSLAIFISCMGLFGLVSFVVQKRTKETGIRKTLGATAFDIVRLLTTEFIKWVILANLISWPIAYYAMNSWLRNFAYRISIGPGIFIFSAVLSLLITFLTISYLTIKTAVANPVVALKYE